MSYNHEILKKFFLDFMMKCYFILLLYAVTEFLACHSSFNVLFFLCFEIFTNFAYIPPKHFS